MPIYEFCCESCGYVLERYCYIGEGGSIVCESCGGPLQRVLSKCSFRLVGGGWADTGYTKASQKIDESISDGV